MKDTYGYSHTPTPFDAEITMKFKCGLPRPSIVGALPRGSSGSTTGLTRTTKALQSADIDIHSLEFGHAGNIKRGTPVFCS